MPEEWYICLEPGCGHRFHAIKPVPERLLRCTKCRSYLVVPEHEYNKCKEKALELISTTILGEVPLWDVVQGVFLERGIRLTPRLTWRLCTRLWSDVLEELRKEGRVG